MASKSYIGINGQSKEISKAYLSIDSLSKRIMKTYVGDENGKSRLCFSDNSDDIKTLKIEGDLVEDVYIKIHSGNTIKEYTLTNSQNLLTLMLHKSTEIEIIVSSVDKYSIFDSQGYKIDEGFSICITAEECNGGISILGTHKQIVLDDWVLPYNKLLYYFNDYSYNNFEGYYYLFYISANDEDILNIPDENDLNGWQNKGTLIDDINREYFIRTGSVIKLYGEGSDHTGFEVNGEKYSYSGYPHFEITSDMEITLDLITTPSYTIEYL